MNPRPVANDITAEKHLLGSLLAAEELIPDVKARLRPDHFFDPAHQRIFDALCHMASNDDATLVVVKNELAKRGELSQIGQGGRDEDGVAYLKGLAVDWGYGLGDNIKSSIDAIRATATLRKLDSMGQAMTRQARATAPHDADEMLKDFREQLFELSTGADADKAVVTGFDAAQEAIDYSEQVKRGDVPAGLTTGFGIIDRMLNGGFQPGDLITLAAATSIGKTAFGLTVAAHVAENKGSVFIVSAEMKRRALGFRLLQAGSGVESGRLRIANLDGQEAKARQDALDKLRWQKISIYDRAADVGTIKLRARQAAAKWHRDKPLSLIIVDYLQLLNPTEGKTRAEQVGAMAWRLKQVAMDLQAPILLLSQLNRESVKGSQQDGRREKKPALFDLKESGDVENSSNAVILLHRPSPIQLTEDGARIVWCKIAKARDGITTPWYDQDDRGIRLKFWPAITRFDPLTL